MTVCGLRWTVTLRVSASVSVRMANKQTYNLKAYSATMDQARECQGMPGNASEFLVCVRA